MSEDRASFLQECFDLAGHVILVQQDVIAGRFVTALDRLARLDAVAGSLLGPLNRAVSAEQAGRASLNTPPDDTPL